MRVFELTGPPGGGKSTVARSLEHAGYTVLQSWQFYFLRKTGILFPPWNSIKYLARAFLAVRRFDLFLIFLSKNRIKFSNFRIFLNIIEKYSVIPMIHKNSKGGDEIVILDEGPAQIAFNFIGLENTVIDLAEVIRPPSIKLLCEADETELKRRLVSRGHWRLSDRFVSENVERYQSLIRLMELERVKNVRIRSTKVKWLEEVVGRSGRD